MNEGVSERTNQCVIVLMSDGMSERMSERISE